MLSQYKRPLIWLGHGIRLAGAVDLIKPFLEQFNVPFITSWQGKDMVDHKHHGFYGHAGIYGHRAANHIVQKADFILTIGTRLALPQTGYDLDKFAPNAKKYIVDIDLEEIAKHKYPGHVGDAKHWMQWAMREWSPCYPFPWHMECEAIRDAMPWLESPLHDDTNEYMNSYRFMWELNKWLKPDQIITTDMGIALLSAYPMLKLNGKQRLITSTGLGEMGSGLPLAIGASIAMGNKEVLCLNCDGGMMMNLQELATIQHHKLPIKIIVFCNEGYSMIKRSQEGMGMNHVGSGKDDLSFPYWPTLASSFGIECSSLKDWFSFDETIKWMQNHNEPCLVEVKIDPDQKIGPKVPTLKDQDGKLYSPELTVQQ